jgi:hypothetical protein
MSDINQIMASAEPAIVEEIEKVAVETIVNPPSMWISIKKGIRVIIQIVLGYTVAFYGVKVESKYGIKVSSDVVAQVTIGAGAFISGALHSLHNWVEHKWPKIKI